MKRFTVFFLLFIFLISLPVAKNNVYANTPVTIYFFWGDGCPHCEKEKPFLEKLEEKYPSVRIRSFEVWYRKENQEVLRKAGEKLHVSITGVPFTVIGEKYITGFQEESSTGKEIEALVIRCIQKSCTDPLADLTGDSKAQIERKAEIPDGSNIPPVLAVPFIGSINIREVSLPVLTVLIAALDGFNPCAMWTLVFLITLLLGMHDRRNMWILGSTFILASAGVYFIFMAAWLNLILFIGFIFWIRLIIGMIALAGGVYNLREYHSNKDAVCKVTGGKRRQKVFEILRELTHEKRFLLALAGIILLAAAVNLVELVCSAGLPVIFTQILAFNALPGWQYAMYMVLYIFIFMLDDLIVFIVSMKTLEVAGVTTKYSHITHLAGGILMLVIGFILILKPELLLFG